MPAEFERIFHVNICVTDLDRSLKWYQEVLGMKVVEGPFMGEGPAMRGIGIGAESVGVDSKTAVKVRARSCAGVTMSMKRSSIFWSSSTRGPLARLTKRCITSASPGSLSASRMSTRRMRI